MPLISLKSERARRQAGCQNKWQFDRDELGLYLNNDWPNGKPSGTKVEAIG